MSDTFLTLKPNVLYVYPEEKNSQANYGQISIGV
jgi:hypothetical protein